jgi:transcriptional regulator with XRE-family HTH domain
MREQKDTPEEQIASDRASRARVELGGWITALRERKGWRQVTLARRAGLRPERLSRIERAIEIPRADELVRLAVVLGVSLDELVYGPAGLPQGGLPRLAGEIEGLASPEMIQGLTVLLQCLALGIKAHLRPGPTAAPAARPEEARGK